MELGRKASIVAALLAGMSGCAGLFGIDEPVSDPCANGGCQGTDGGVPMIDGTALDGAAASEATVDDQASEASPEGAVDAPPDQGPLTGVRCGSDGLRCSGAKPFCCEIVGDGGGAYGCVASQGSCTDYWIQCASASDCASTSPACCHYNSSMKCEPSCSSTSILVCDPSVDASCPPGKTCNVALQNRGQPAPYFLCSP